MTPTTPTVSEFRDGMISVREAAQDDVPLVLAYVRKLAAFEGLEDHLTATQTDIENAMRGGKLIRALLAYVGGESAGFVTFRYAYSTFSGKPSLYVEDIFVDEEFRQKGIARLFFERLAEIARSEGCARLEWSVLEWNERAMAFYRSVGGAPHLGWQIWRRELSGE